MFSQDSVLTLLGALIAGVAMFIRLESKAKYHDKEIETLKKGIDDLRRDRADDQKALAESLKEVSENMNEISKNLIELATQVRHMSTRPIKIDGDQYKRILDSIVEVVSDTN